MGFKSFSTADFLHNLLSPTHPDTVPASPVKGDVIFGNSTPAWQRLGVGAEQQVLTVAGGVPQWANPSVFVADYYLTDDAADVATYKYMQTAFPVGAKTSVAVLIDSADNVPKTIQNWITPVGFPHTTFIPQGTWTVHFHAAQLTGSEDNRVTVELYKRTVGNVETLLGIAGPSPIIDQTTEVEYDIDAAIPDTILLTTDRIVARVRSTPLGGGTNGTVTIYYRGNTATRLGLPVSATSLDHGTLLGLGDDDHPQYLKRTESPHIVGITIGDGVNVPATGLKGTVRFPWAGTIIEWSICANAVGNITFDVWKEPFAGYPPTVANTITAADKPKITGAASAEGTALTGWTIAVAAGDVFAFNLDSVATISRATLVLVVQS